MLGNLVDVGHVGESVLVLYLQHLQIHERKTGRVADCQLPLRWAIFLMSGVDSGQLPVLSEAAESSGWEEGSLGSVGSVRGRTGDSPSPRPS